MTHGRFLFKAPVDLLLLLLQLVAQLLLRPLLLFLQEAQLSQLLPPEETATTSVNSRYFLPFRIKSHFTVTRACRSAIHARP